MFSAGAQAAAENLLRGSEEGNVTIEPQATDWAPYIVSDSDKGYFTGRWTVYSGLGSDTEDESTTPDEESIVSESALRTWRTASVPPVDRSRTAEDRRRYEELARRLGLSPSSEWGTIEAPAEAFRDGLLRSASSERRTTEEAHT
jgi:hypothetical protein